MKPQFILIALVLAASTTADQQRSFGNNPQNPNAGNVPPLRNRVQPQLPTLNNEGQGGIQPQFPISTNGRPEEIEPQPTLVESCGGSADIDLSQIRISGCDPSYPRCRLIRGQNARMVLPFIPARSAKTIQPVVHGLLANIIPIPFQIPEDNGCINSGLQCPLQSGRIHNYVAELPVHQDYPRIRIGVKWQLMDELNNEVVCIIFPAELTDD
ncbi:NPC intracellular cholesterol transporter 2-like [Palaemon carinicauda]|uniref:NPC intracellular cholesterol transporter 2-like n=1 Tax=Palaemon carinicauda TaxID=392227 RepID=UPI0035B5E472